VTPCQPRQGKSASVMDGKNDFKKKSKKSVFGLREVIEEKRVFGLREVIEEKSVFGLREVI
jgi:hypothetical protein